MGSSILTLPEPGVLKGPSNRLLGRGADRRDYTAVTCSLKRRRPEEDRGGQGTDTQTERGKTTVKVKEKGHCFDCTVEPWACAPWDF
ncbi:hypothetical protein CesoFtcFv8_024974 [Champsocephalus esox]|uniref:Uncharacterized protein n=1 Tax=Champsocephalus esox TaxID=159716 RepID=A0AAN8B3N4_9TELE|nr:hypothetical protein CesoFtcFv8_024974 [Champsocephalus esox]